MPTFIFNKAVFQDAAGRVHVKSRGDNTPPVSPAGGDAYLIGTTPTGAWATHANECTIYSGTAWLFEASPPDGLLMWVDDDQYELLCVNGGFRLSVPLLISLNADQLLSPNSSDWAVNALAGTGADSNNAAVTVPRLDKPPEGGKGFWLDIPMGATRMELDD